LWDSVADMAIILSAIAGLLPLILTPHLLFYYDVTPKVAVLLAGAALALPLTWREPRTCSPGLRILAWLLAAQAVSLALSTATSTDPALSLGGGAWRRFGLITQAAMLLFVWPAAQYTAGDSRRLLRLLRMIAAAGIPAALYGILQYFGWDPLIDPAKYHIGVAPFTIVRPPGTLGYVSYFATYLLTVIFAGAALAIADDSRAWKLAGALAGALAIVAVILTGTRAAILGLGVGATFLALWLGRPMRRRALAASALAAAVLAGFYFSPAGEMLRSRARWFAEDPLGGGRLLLWRDSLRMAGARWPLGFGLETFSTYFPRYQSAELAKQYPQFYQESPHNIFLDALVSQGLVGLALLLAVTVLGFYAIWRMENRRLAAALGAALAATLVSQQFTSFILPTAVFFYLTIALLVGQAFLPVHDPKTRPRSLLLLPAALSLLFIAYAVSLTVADAVLARTDRLVRAGNPTEAVALHRRFAPWQPPGMRTDLWYSRAIGGVALSDPNRQEAVALHREALAAAVRASRTAEDRENAWLNLAFFYGLDNDYPHTEQSLRAAIEFAPHWFKPHWLLAQVLAAGGHLAQARAEADQAADLNGDKNPEVAETARQIHEKTSTSKK